MSDNKKSRICEVLGVEPLQEWTVPGRSEKVYRVTGDGHVQCENSNGVWIPSVMPSSLLADIINHPELIVRKPRWTAEDIGDAKAIKRLFPEVETIHRGGANCTGLYIHDSCHYRLNDELFPELKEGESVALDEILEVGQGDTARDGYTTTGYSIPEYTPEEAEQVRDYCKAHGIDPGRVIGMTQEAEHERVD